MLNTHTLIDVNLVRTVALPAAGASALSPVIDTAQVNPGRITREVELLLTIPATPALADAKNTTLTVQDSADGVTFAPNAEIPAVVATGAGGIGSTGASGRFKLPISLRRYVKLGAAVDAAGGNNTAVSASLSFVF